MKHTFDIKASPADADIIKTDIENKISIPTDGSVIKIAGYGLRVILEPEDATWVKSKYGDRICA